VCENQKRFSGAKVEKRLRKQRIFLRWAWCAASVFVITCKKDIAPKGQKPTAQGSALGERSQPMKVRPEGAKEWSSLYNCLLPLQGAFSLGRVTQGAASLALGYV